MNIDVKTNHLRAALLFAAKNDIRFYLNGVHFLNLNGLLAIEATDGCRLIRITTDTELIEPLDVIAPNGMIKSILREKSSKLSVNFEAKSASFERLTHRQTWTFIDGKFPYISEIIPTNWELPPILGLFNPRYIADAWASVFAFKAVDINSEWLSCGVKMLSAKDQAVYREKLDGDVVEIVIMAMRT